MAWDISITAEGWQGIREKLERWSSEALIDAMCDDKFEAVIDKVALEHATLAANTERKRLDNLPYDILVDRAFDLIATNTTSDNGGWMNRWRWE